ncbi:hypothetical protein [Rhodococcus sp. 06-235-1A]|uniref:hypothetical protein n=1 Tax=Rhodococcus sp. 06-235-1A TaxID=2022508 RepID=UPI00117B1ED6|nr:hypothetical protein [Rhodococcus sp. 06-235-1A]
MSDVSRRPRFRERCHVVLTVGRLGCTIGRPRSAVERRPNHTPRREHYSQAHLRNYLGASGPGYELLGRRLYQIKKLLISVAE